MAQFIIRLFFKSPRASASAPVCLFLLVVFAGFSQELPAQEWTKEITDFKGFPRVHENDISWDAHAGCGVYGFGHNESKSNRTALFKRGDKQFIPVDDTFHRPPRRCGVKFVYDELMKYTWIVGGAPHWGYGTIAGDGKTLRGGNIATTRIWGFDGTSRQWRNMRTVGPIPRKDSWRGDVGYDHTMTYAPEYGLSFLLYGKMEGSPLRAYHGYSNRWISFPSDGQTPENMYSAAIAWDPGEHQLVKIGGWHTWFKHRKKESNKTYVYDMAGKKWKQLDLDTPPPVWRKEKKSPARTSTVMNYDRRDGVLFVVSADGRRTATLELGTDPGWNVRETPGGPPCGGHNGDGFAYDPAHDVHYLACRVNFAPEEPKGIDEIWSFDGPDLIRKRIARPEGLQRTTTRNKVKLSWETDEGSDLTYRIRRAKWTSLPGEYTEIGSTDGGTFVDQPPMKEGVEFSYTVTAVDRNGNESDPSRPVFTYPVRPEGLVASVAGEHRVELRWKENSGKDITGYHVYRGKGKIPLWGVTRKEARNHFTRLTEHPVQKPSFVDGEVDLGDQVIRSYTVRAVNRLGRTSGRAPLAFSIPAIAGGPWLDRDEMKIRWLPPAGEHIKGYHVYRGIFSRGGKRPEHRLTERPIDRTHFKIDPEVCASYTVAAVNAMGKIGFGSDDVFHVGPKVPGDGDWCRFKQFHTNSKTIPVRPDPLRENE